MRWGCPDHLSQRLMYKTHDRSFQTVRRECEAWKWGNICSVSVSFVRVGSQIHPHVGPTSGEERFKYPLPRENKIGQMPYPRANKDNQIPTPCPSSPPRAGFTLIGALSCKSKNLIYLIQCNKCKC